MKQMILADSQRMFRGWMIYLSFGALIVLPAFHGWSIFSVIMSINATGNPVNVLLILPALLQVLITEEFDYKTIKNPLSMGICRTKFFISKWALASILCVMAYFVHLGSGMAIATIRGQSLNDTSAFENFLIPVFIELAVLLAFTTLMVTCGFIVKKTSLFSIIPFAMAILPFLTIQWLGTHIYEVFLLLQNIELLEILQGAVYMAEAQAMEVIRTMGVPFGWIAVGILVGWSNFQKSAIR
ncbi:MAG: ABC transporter permease [Turicibacter sp.]|nr:ABC transporter permease [Turicibacter sp.]